MELQRGQIMSRNREKFFFFFRIAQFPEENCLESHYNTGRLRRAAFTKWNSGHKLKLPNRENIKLLICMQFNITQCYNSV